MRVYSALALGALVLFSGCPSTGENISCYPSHQFSSFTQYSFRGTYSTPRYGIEVDDPQRQLDIPQLEGTLSNVEACMQQFVTVPLTEVELKEADCVGAVVPEVRSCLQIQTAPDWQLSACTGEQVFPCAVGNQRCFEKEQIPTEQCPCSCRAIVQDNQTIIVTPNLRLLPANLVTLMTGCLNPWGGRLGQCASTSTIPPLATK